MTAEKIYANSEIKAFFEENIESRDKEIFDAIKGEEQREQDQIELIASENIVSKAVKEAQGSNFTNKYAEGYPGKRYYGGCEYADIVENLAIDRAKELYDVEFVNVQPNSGSQANQGVFTALIKPGDTILGQSLASGGHLTHGAKPNQSGKWFNAVQYGVDKETHLLDYDEIEALAKEHKPKMLIGGFSAYPQIVDWARLRKIADSVDAYFLVDMAHISGLVAAGVYPSPIPHAHIVTTTTHKTLRGPRGGMILTNDETIAKKVNSAIFPGIQGGPLVHVIAAKAVCFKEALDPSFKVYMQSVVANAKILAKTLKNRGLNIVSGSTVNHLVLVDLTPKSLTGKATEEALEAANLTCNKNAIPFDPQKPFVTSGIRLGTSAGTTRGFGLVEFEKVGNLIGDIVDALAAQQDMEQVTRKVKEQVKDLCNEFPVS
ncbi:MAG: serine hydroxymethyltransferase [Alphaproteobacteria bacterium]|jgi:glycine hydroxymethyltransferase|nr:serine hydroxymethyltransferase [Alphaproteobacteria bacterium]